MSPGRTVASVLIGLLLGEVAGGDSTVDMFDIAVEDVRFEENSASLSACGVETLSRNARVLAGEYLHANVLVEGHRDESEREDVAEARAEAVIEFLVREGIARERLRAVSRGAELPVAPMEAEWARAKNRRVHFLRMAAPVDGTP